MNQRYLMGWFALMTGVLVNYLGDKLLGIRMELFLGLATFSFKWMLDVFVLPLLVGLLMAWIFGRGAKWLCYFPPLIVRCFSYWQILYVTGVPHGAMLNPMGWWGLYVILAMESAGIGGIMGEVLIKNIYGRSNMLADVITEEAMVEKES